MIAGAWCMRRTSMSASSSASPPAAPRSAFARSPKPTWATASSRPRNSWLSHGSYGIGSDSNVLIDAAQELRVLEYTQRLAHRARNCMAIGDGRSTGRALFECALEGGSRALGTPNGGLRVGAAADLISLDANHDALTNRAGDALLDSWIFAARPPAVDCVWRYGRKVVSGGRHRQRDEIASRYRASLKRLLAV